MIIKKFYGKTEEEAVALAKKELGENVVIMNTRNAKVKGFLGIFKKKTIEITAAMEEEPDKLSFKMPAAPKPSALDQVLTKEPKKEPVFETKQAALQKDSSSDKVLEEKLESLHSLIEQQLLNENDTQEESFPEEDDKNVAFMKLIYNTLIDNEVAEKYANELIDELERIKKPKVTIDFLLGNIYQKMILKFGQANTIAPAKDGVKVIFFIGPTGVGKTTTIAKLASKLSVNEKKKVALLTTDTYRIAAAEQLRTYASILDAPFRVIYTCEEQMKALEDFKSYDFILIDTAGHSHTNETQKNSMSAFVNSVEEQFEKEVYLVVSATTKYRDLLSITEAYKEVADYKLIFTKLDETTTLGNLYNLKLHTGADMSYITCGQVVPDDIEQFSPQSTVKQLLGGK